MISLNHKTQRKSDIFNLHDLLGTFIINIRETHSVAFSTVWGDKELLPLCGCYGVVRGLIGQRAVRGGVNSKLMTINNEAHSVSKRID